ncbi:MAG: hypothetical protein WCJ26_10415 [bacterium]
MNSFPPLNPTYFWDVDYAGLDPVKSKRIIIERTFTLGNMAEMKSMIVFYGEEEIKNTLVQINYIDPKNLNFLSLIFRIPKRNFKCVLRQQSTRQHWI